MLIRLSIITDGGLEVFSYQSHDYRFPIEEPQLLSGLMTALQSLSEQVDHPIQQIQFSNMMLYIRTYGDFGIHLLFEEKISDSQLGEYFEKIAKEVVSLIGNVEKGAFPPREEFEIKLLPLVENFVKDPLEGTKIAQTSPSESLSRIAMVGLANAGKTTLKNMFFEKWSKEMINDIHPTTGLQMQIKMSTFLKEKFLVMDFGGQSVYRQSYLEDKKKWRNLSVIIFVVDIQDVVNYNIAKRYLDDIWRLLQEENVRIPKLSIFLHKCDEDKRETINENIKAAMIAFKEYAGLATFHLSTIDNNSGIIAMLKTLYFSLPNLLLKRFFEDKFLAHFEQEILPKFYSIASENGFLLLLQDLKPRIRQSAVNHGLKYGRLMQEEWLKYILGEWKPDERRLSSKSLTLGVQGQYMFLTFQGYTELNFPLELTTLLIDGTLEGILKTFHLASPEMIENDDNYSTTWKITI